MFILRHSSQRQANFVEMGEEPHEGDHNNPYCDDDNSLKVDRDSPMLMLPSMNTGRV